MLYQYIFVPCCLTACIAEFTENSPMLLASQQTRIQLLLVSSNFLIFWFIQLYVTGAFNSLSYQGQELQWCRKADDCKKKKRKKVVFIIVQYGCDWRDFWTYGLCTLLHWAYFTSFFPFTYINLWKHFKIFHFLVLLNENPVDQRIWHKG